MALLFFTLFDNADGVTLAGGAAIGSGKLTISQVGGAHADTARMTDAIAGATGQVIYYKWRYSSITGTQDYAPGLITNSTTVNFTAKPAEYVSTDTIYNYDGNSSASSGITILANTDYFGKVAVNSNGTVSWSHSVTSYSADWQAVGNSVVADCFNATASNLRYAVDLIAVNAGTEVLTVYEFFYTSDGLFSPTPPSALAADATGQTTIELEWTDNGTAVSETGLILERSLSSGSGYAEIADLAQGEVDYEDTGLDPSTTYYYRIKGYKTIGATDYDSAYSSVANATTDSPPVTSTPGADGLMVDIIK